MTAPRRVHVGQGDHRVSAHPDVMLSTVLGSCVAACLHDPKASVGGMNHFLLPDGAGEDQGADRYGVNAMELLINGLLVAGASRDRLQAKVFGGSRMFAGLADIGGRNAIFVRDFLAREGIPIVAESLGGAQARRVQFWPVTGRCQQRFVDADAAPIPAPPRAPPVRQDAGELELF